MEITRSTQLFLSLVNSFQMQTMMQLGKLKNPFTEESERDLDSAQISIDILDMIKEKTSNNLSEDESKYLSQVLADLKINFVEEKNKDTNKPETGGSTETEDDNSKNDDSKPEDGIDKPEGE